MKDFKAAILNLFQNPVVDKLQSSVWMLKQRPAGFQYGDLSAGFTLIELLVVVLIIGILSSVALPQYQKAVLKARFANMRQVAAQYKAAEEAYYLANGSYTNQINDLDVSFPSCRLVDDVLVCDNYFMLDPLLSSRDGVEPERANLMLAYCPAAIQGNYTECYTAADFVYTVWLTYSSKPDQTACAGNTSIGTAFCRSVK
ncbi:MAG: prepilin-type N-terminal cleavage/methylation domain-containing protein [Elusimicrobiales bacterium]|nr:prepilin-type N-terminal cleavage/methylation domain-containing protein [Elusimicrobiales bacterium]